MDFIEYTMLAMCTSNRNVVRTVGVNVHTFISSPNIFECFSYAKHYWLWQVYNDKLKLIYAAVGLTL